MQTKCLERSLTHAHQHVFVCVRRANETQMNALCVGVCVSMCVSVGTIVLHKFHVSRSAERPTDKERTTPSLVGACVKDPTVCVRYDNGCVGKYSPERRNAWQIKPFCELPHRIRKRDGEPVAL